MMTPQRRELVIEFEKIQLIRKRAKTSLMFCTGCGAITDFVRLLEAADIFESEPENLFRFIKTQCCHFHGEDTTRLYLCVVSLVTSMKRQNRVRRLLA